MNNLIDKADTVLGKVYDDVVHPVAKPIGEILGFLPRSVKVLLYGYEKWIINGEESLRLTAQAIQQKAEAIPEERLTEPEPYVIVPAIQQLAYSYSSDELRELYANLIVSSMDKEKKDQVHPAFVDILKKLTPDEAKILQYCKGKDSIEYVDLRAYLKGDDEGFKLYGKRGTLLSDEVSFDIPDNEPAYLENLACLGILKDCDTLYKIAEDSYERIEEKLGLNRIRTLCVPDQFKSIRPQRSVYQVTAFGKSFIDTVVA